MMLGTEATTYDIGEIRRADLLFVVGSNTTETHPFIATDNVYALARRYLYGSSNTHATL